MKYFQIHLKFKSWLFLTICSICIQWTTSIRFKPSPCPGKFNYESTTNDDRWYGDITFPVNTSIDGSTIRVELDRPSQLLVTTAGPITTKENRVYFITHDDVVLEKGSTYKLIFMVKFDKENEVPMLETIHFNGQRICPPDLVTLALGGTNDFSSSRPDIKATAPTDVLSDIDKKPKNPIRTTTQSTFSHNNNGENINFFNENSNVNRLTTTRIPNSSNLGGNSNGNQGNSGYHPNTSNNFGNSFGGSNNQENQGNNGYNPSSTQGNNGYNPSSTHGNNGYNPSSTSNNNQNNLNQANNGYNPSSTSNNQNNLNQANNGFGSGNSNNYGNNGASLGNNGFSSGNQDTFGSNWSNLGSNSNSNLNQGSSGFNNFGSNSNSNQGTSGNNGFSGGGQGNKNPNQGGEIFNNEGVTNNGFTTRPNIGNEATVSGGTIACGTVSIANPLITLAQNSEYGQWPWHVALFMRDEVNPSKSSYICGGSLVSKNKVITAAHCVSLSGNRIVNPNSLTAYMGKYNINTDESTSQKRVISALKVNPEYNKANFHNDIAILNLSEDVEFTNYVRPICLWEADEGIQDIVGKDGMVVGWGYNEYQQLNQDLKQATMPIVSAEKCARSDPQFFSEYVSDNAFCAGSLNGTGPCKGDSGGGLVLKRNNSWYLRGIVSVSAAPKNGSVCNNHHYIVFTDTAKYTDFIRRNL